MAGTRRWLQGADILLDENTGELLVRLGGSITAKRIKISASSNAAAGNILVAGVTGKKICILSLCLIAADVVNATFYSGPADTGTAISGPLPLGANGGFVINAPADADIHWLETAIGQDLRLKLDAAVQCSGWLVYYEK